MWGQLCWISLLHLPWPSSVSHFESPLQGLHSPLLWEHLPFTLLSNLTFLRCPLALSLFKLFSSTLSDLQHSSWHICLISIGMMSMIFLWFSLVWCCNQPVRIFQAKRLEWVTISYSRGSPQPIDQTHVSCVSWIGRWVLTTSATWEAPQYLHNSSKILLCVSVNGNGSKDLAPKLLLTVSPWYPFSN